MWTIQFPKSIYRPYTVPGWSTDYIQAQKTINITNTPSPREGMYELYIVSGCICGLYEVYEVHIGDISPIEDTRTIYRSMML